MFLLIDGKEFSMKLIICREPKEFHCLPCNILFGLDQEPKVRRHVVEDHRIEYVPDEFGDVWDCGEVVTPDALRKVGAV